MCDAVRGCARRLLGISRGAAYRAAACGQIPTIHLGRRLLVPTARLHQLLGIHHTDDAEPGDTPAADARTAILRR